MRQHQLIFNAIGVAIGFILLVSLWSLVGNGTPLAVIFWAGTVAVLVGGGSLSNLVNRGMGLWPTITIIIGCFIAVVLIPLGIWGIIVLKLDRKRRRHRHRTIQSG
jgi:hypothetical protein